jgi:hypothetical protein
LIERRCKGNEEESGFTKGRSTTDHIYVIRQILENEIFSKKIQFDIGACLLKARIVKPAETAVAKKPLCKLAHC